MTRTLEMIAVDRAVAVGPGVDGATRVGLEGAPGLDAADGGTSTRPTAARAAGTDAAGDRPIPESHLDLLTRPIVGILTTLGRDGRPQSSLVWVDHDGECACVNTTLERQKGRNMVADPRVSLLVVDPDDTGRFLQVRGDAELVEAGAIGHLDELTRRYTRYPRYYGYIYPEEQRAREVRVISRIHARRISLDAIHR